MFYLNRLIILVSIAQVIIFKKKTTLFNLFKLFPMYKQLKCMYLLVRNNVNFILTENYCLYVLFLSVFQRKMYTNKKIIKLTYLKFLLKLNKILLKQYLASEVLIFKKYTKGCTQLFFHKNNKYFFISSMI